MNKANLEAFKNIARWVLMYGVSFAISWFITETLTQANAIPEHFVLNIWVFVYNIPIRQLFTFALTLVGGYVDKYLHEIGKQRGDKSLAKGLTRF